jgi:RecA-family ATPase
MAQEMEAPSWMIEGIWTDKSHGIIGGEPKTLKTTLALAMGIAVASGKPFLGTFEVPSPGPVLMVQEENDPRNVQDTMRKVASSYGLISKGDATTSPSPTGSIGSTVVDVRFPDDIPFWLWNNEGLNLTVEESRELLLQDIRELRPKLLILDPIQYCFGDNVDFDRAHEIRPQLRWLMGLRFEYEMAIILIHHFRKSEATRSGQRMLGSTMFHGWTSSALYFKDRTEEDGWKRIEVEREFREQGPQTPMKVALQMGAPGSLDFDATVTGFDQQSQLTELVQMVDGITMKQAADELGVSVKIIARRANHCPIRIEGGGKGNTRRMYYDASA